MDRDPRFDEEKREQAAALYRQGLSERAVAERLGVTKTTARRYLDDAGVRRRTLTAAQKRRWSPDGVGRRRPDTDPQETAGEAA